MLLQRSEGNRVERDGSPLAALGCAHVSTPVGLRHHHSWRRHSLEEQQRVFNWETLRVGLEVLVLNEGTSSRRPVGALAVLSLLT